jgi:hypothetical protein
MFLGSPPRRDPPARVHRLRLAVVTAVVVVAAVQAATLAGCANPVACENPQAGAVTLSASPAVSSLVGAWGFEETSGTTTVDASGGGGVGTMMATSVSPA